MIGGQSNVGVNTDRDADPPEAPSADPSDNRSRSVNRRLTIVALGSIILAGLTTLMLSRLHASPAPAEASDSASRPAFPDGPSAHQQVFVAPKLTSTHASVSVDPADPAAASATDSAAMLAMPLSSPNSQWRLPAGTADVGPAPAPAESSKPDRLMVDVAPAEADGALQDQVIHAQRHDPHGLLLAAGSVIGCALETAIDSSHGGYVTCVVTDDVVSDDARVVLIERGTHVMGEYHSDARLGDARIGIVWNRLRKSDGTTVDLASPGTDQQGRAGISGGVDNHWLTRIGAAVLLSVIEDGIAAASAPKSNGTTLVFGNTAASGSTLSQKVLDASINQPPTITVNPGARISILVAKDIDFRGTYANH